MQRPALRAPGQAVAGPRPSHRGTCVRPAMQISLFDYGFRPFFLGAGLAALLLVPWWAAHLTLGVPLATDWPPALWHAHEMLFGFVCAAIAGFLLTAVPSWTGRKGFAGGPLVAMSALWLFGRLLVASSASWPRMLVTSVDLAFLPLLGAFVARPLLRERNRNTPLLLVLLALWLCNAVFHLGLLRGDAVLARQALVVGIDLVAVMVTVVGGRIVPSFTAGVLRRHGMADAVRAPRTLSTLAVGLMVAVAVVDWLQPGSACAGWTALAAAVAQGMRLARWQGHRMHREPLVWILHVAYAWLPVGLALKALALLAGLPMAAHWLHALTVGAIATMILGVMTRVPLGHTGRPLRLHPFTIAAYLLAVGAAFVRVLGPRLLPADYLAVIATSAALWTAAFGLFLLVYAPVLLMPRLQGSRR